VILYFFTAVGFNTVAVVGRLDKNTGKRQPYTKRETIYKKYKNTEYPK